jgi:putative endonuclease
MMHHNQKIGHFGENLAKTYLEKKGYKIIDMNVKLQYQEIDIIAEIREILVFIEVKTRIRGGRYGPAQMAMNRQKTKNIKKAINVYLMRKNLEPKELRLDLIAIDLNTINKKANIKHFENI